MNKSKKNSKRSREKSKKKHIENKSIVSLNFTINQFIILLISLIKVLALSDNETNLIYTKFSNITLKIKGNGTKNILGHESGASFSSGSYPKYIYINNVLQNTRTYSYDFTEEENDVKLVWENSINNGFCMFRCCTDITEIDFTNFDSSEITWMDSMFYGCTSLTSINFSNFDASFVVSMEHLFYNCYSLIYLDLTNFNTTSVRRMNEMFYGCSSLTSLDLSNFDISEVTWINSMFYGCINLEYINMNNFKETKINNGIDYFKNMFEGIPENVVICINEENNKNKILPQIKEKKCYLIDCSEEWESNQIKLVNKSLSCIDNNSNLKLNNILSCPNLSNQELCAKCDDDFYLKKMIL